MVSSGQNVLILSFIWSDIHLTRSAYSIRILVHHFQPMGYPAYASCHREHDCKHIFGDADGFVDYTCVEIDIRIQFPLLKIFILKG